MITIRAARPGDSQAVAQVITESWHDNTADPTHIARVIRDTARVTLLAEQDRAVLGFVDSFLTLAADGTPRWEVDLLGVRPAARGRQIARQLVSAAVEAGRAQGAMLARALIRRDNPASQRVFAACGFSELAQRQILYLADFEAGPRQHITHGCWLLPVVTLTYRGLWIEGAPARSDFAAARAIVEWGGWDVAGAVLPANSTAIEAASSAGFQAANEYAWWTRALTADAEPALRSGHRRDG